MAISPEQRVVQLAADHHQLVSRQQVITAGMTPRQIRYRLSTGRWRQVRPGVFAVDGRLPGTWEATVLAAVLALPDAVASHRTALWLHDVQRLGRPEVIEVSVPLGCRAVLPGVRVRQRRDLPVQDRGQRREIPVTTPERTMIDLAGELELVDRLGAFDEAVVSGVLNRRRFVHRAGECSAGRAGVRLLADAAADGGAGRFRSWLEQRADAIWRAAGLPAPAWNVVLRDHRGRIGEVDAVFPGSLVVVELDGLRFHRSPAQRRRDAARDRRLQLSGRIVLRYTWEDVVTRPDVVVAEIGQALAAASR